VAVVNNSAPLAVDGQALVKKRALYSAAAVAVDWVHTPWLETKEEIEYIG
jgi:hypothetical protein